MYQIHCFPIAMAVSFFRSGICTGILFGFWLVVAPLQLLKAQGYPQALDTTKLLTQFMVDSWTTDQGLPNNAVLAQVKASDGYFWLATYDGLVRFDGMQSKVYKQANTPTLTTNSLFSIFEDSENTIWIGTNGQGVVQYKEEFFTVPSFNTELPNKTITAFTEDKQGRLWIGSRKGLVCIQNGMMIEVPEPLGKLNIYCLYTDEEGILWIGTLGAGLWKYDGVNLRQYTRRQGLSSNSVRSVKKAKDGKLWIGTEEGICMMMQNIIMPMAPEFSTFINGIDIDAFGTVWFGTDVGLVRYTRKNFDLLKIGDGHSTDAIQTVYCGEEGSLWVGTYHKGFIRLHDGKFRNYTLQEGLPNELIHAVYAEQDSVWFGTDKGLSLLTGKGKIVNYTVGKGSLENRVRTILRSKKGRMYLGTYAGLYVKAGNSFEKIEMEGEEGKSLRVRRLLEDKKGHLWVGSNSGLYRLEKGGRKVKAILPELKNSYVMALFTDKEDRLWIGTNGNGVFCLTKENKLRHYQMEEGLASGVVFDIVEDRGGSLWLMTNNGISHYEGAGRFSSADESNGLFANTLFQLLEDKAGNFWFATNRGVVQVSPSVLKKLLREGTPLTIADYKYYTKANGLRSTGITPSSRSAVDHKGRLWFATLYGISAIDPIHLPLNRRAPLNKIEKMVADKTEYAAKRQVVLPAGTRYLEFHYTGINYRSPASTRFRYQLENFEEVWHDAGTMRKAYYTNIPPGEYVFKVKAANEDGLWNEEAAALAFVQEAFFYEKAWFKGLLILLILLGGVLLYVLRMRKLRYQNKYLNSLVHKRTTRIRNQHDAILQQKEELKRLNGVKDRLLSIISHDLRGPLTSTMGILSMFHQRQIAEGELRQFSGELSQFVGRQVNMLDNLLSWARSQMAGLHEKPERLNLYQVVEEIFMLYRQDAESKKIKLLNQVNPEGYVLADKNLLQLVIRNLLFNSLKFTNENGTISVRAVFQEGTCQVEVVDDGIGMSREQLAQVFRGKKLSSGEGLDNEKGNGLGLAICKEFVEKWGGKIWAESYEGKGSRFKFTLKEFAAQAGEE